MKTSELISMLQECLITYGDREVEATWEGIFRGIEPDNIYFSRFGTLLIDADDNMYKCSFEFKPAKR